MKRHQILIFMAMLAVCLLAGCTGTAVVVAQSETEASVVDTAAPANGESSVTADGESGATADFEEGALKLGMAILPKISGSQSATAETTGKGTFDVTVVIL